MRKLDYANVAIGQMLPELKLSPISRTTLALFAGASGDHNPIHIDSDFARQAGMPDVFAHGMLSMAYLGRMLTDWVPQQCLREFNSRFSALAHLGNVLICSGKVVAKYEEGGEKLVKVEIQSTDQFGEVKVLGEALVAL